MKPLQRLLSCVGSTCLAALFALPKPTTAQDRNVFFDADGDGESKAIARWGLDTAWLNEANVQRGVRFMGQPQVDVIRFSFTGDWPLNAGDLGTEAQAEFDARMAIVNAHTAAGTALYLNNDTGTYDAAFIGGDGRVEPVAWSQLIDATRARAVAAGRTVLSVSPYNEPDTSVEQGDINRLGDVIWQLRNTLGANFTGIDIYGGTTLDNDQAGSWYDTLNGWGFVEEGSTHQLAGSFDSYAAFFQNVDANGDDGVNDELHNVVEAMVGAEYGMDAGIWWGTAEYARGEFVKASDGVRLAYAEHRPNWTAASVYRSPAGKVQAFVGASERQAATTSYRFVSTDRNVYFDGHGPRRAYTIEIPGGSGYQVDQPNAERLVNITWGEDVQPAINGRYILVARHSGKVMDVNAAGTADGDNVQQWTYTGGDNQHWDVTPVDSRIGGDFSYFTISAVHSGKVLDVLNWSLDDGGNIHQWGAANGANQQFFLEYVEDGWFHIRSRWSGKYLDVAGPSVDDGANIHQWTGNGGYNQQWRLIPVGAAVEFDAPAAPTGLSATANAASVTLTWEANQEPDLDGYNVYRASAPEGPFELIARSVSSAAYTDGAANQPVAYYYQIRAVDKSLNRSVYSAQVNATPLAGRAMVARFDFEGGLADDSGNANHGELSGTSSYTAGRIGSQALSFGGESHVTLPGEFANHDELTVAGWVLWNGGNDWQRIFDFGNGTEEYLYLTPKAGGGGTRFEIRQGATVAALDAPALPTGVWTHFAVVLGAAEAALYIDGVAAHTTAALPIKPSDINPALNLLGDSQWDADPLLDGTLDDFRVFNYALSAAEVGQVLAGGIAAPTITQQPQAWTVTIGQSATFTVVPAGSPPLFYQWKKGEDDIPGATSDSLTLNDLQLSQSDDYSVVISNLAGEITSSAATLTVNKLEQTITFGSLPNKLTTDTPFTLSATASSGLTVTYASSDTGVATVSGSTVTIHGAGTTTITASQAGDATYLAAPDVMQTLTVHAPVEITQQPQSQTVNVGQSAIFTVVATGSPTLTYQWKKGENDIPGATSATLTLDDVQTSQAGSYSVVVTNPAGEITSSAATLTVNKLEQTITFGSLPNKLTTDTAFTLSATASSGLTVAYASSDTGVASVNGSTVTIHSAGTTTITASQAGDSTYLPASDVMQTLTVHAPVEITQQPQSQTVNVGQSATFTVVATGSPTLTYQWKKGEDDIQGATGASLTLDDVQTSQAGDYSVVVTNPAGPLTSASVTLTVRVPPHLLEPLPTFVTATLGDTLSIPASVGGDQPITFQWKHRLPNDQQYSDIAGADSATLSIASVTTTDRGLYVLEMSNPAGTVTTDPITFQVRQLNRPEFAPKQQGGDQKFGFKLAGAPSRTLIIEASTDLKMWTILATVTLGSDGRPSGGIQLMNGANLTLEPDGRIIDNDTDRSTGGQRWYRVRTEALP